MRKLFIITLLFNAIIAPGSLEADESDQVTTKFKSVLVFVSGQKLKLKVISNMIMIRIELSSGLIV